ncbi:MAG: lipocalin-like domain-containing protein [bacterium]|nr:lipocalin-like domain-containing protein [bacterium]MDT8396219.1 lipocalin-like domain-containing protein [bacterium]
MLKIFPRTAAVGVCLLLAGLAAPPFAAGEGFDGWREAAGVRSWSFPADHGSHPDFQTEWWYFTGNLVSPGGRQWGYQLTFFRMGLATEAALPENPWSVRDLYLAHLAVTDVQGKRFSWDERTSRAGPGLAGAKEGELEVWLLDWRAVMEDGSIALAARSGEMEIDLVLTPGKPPVLHGEGGLSAKGPAHGQASWYTSITDLRTTGSVRVAGEEEFEVSGKSWFDHEFGSNQLTAGQEGWDWFSLHLADGTEIMLYRIRRTDGSVEPASSGTLVTADGSAEHLALADFSVEVVEKWKSPASGGAYPAGWKIRIPKAGLNIDVSPLVKDQELTTRGTAGITYWEGAVRVEGRSGEREVTGAGYVELTGYAGSLGGIF